MPSSYKKPQEQPVVIPKESIYQPETVSHVLTAPSEAVAESTEKNPSPTIASAEQRKATGEHTAGEQNFFLIVGAFRTHQNAFKLREELQQQGYSGANILDSSRNNFTLVYIKGFGNFTDASANLKELQQQGKDAWIYRR